MGFPRSGLFGQSDASPSDVALFNHIEQQTGEYHAKYLWSNGNIISHNEVLNKSQYLPWVWPPQSRCRQWLPRGPWWNWSSHRGSPDCTDLWSWGRSCTPYAVHRTVPGSTTPAQGHSDSSRAKYPRHSTVGAPGLDPKPGLSPVDCRTRPLWNAFPSESIERYVNKDCPKTLLSFTARSPVALSAALARGTHSPRRRQLAWSRKPAPRWWNTADNT